MSFQCDCPKNTNLDLRRTSLSHVKPFRIASELQGWVQRPHTACAHQPWVIGSHVYCSHPSHTQDPLAFPQPATLSLPAGFALANIFALGVHSPTVLCTLYTSYILPVF